MAPAPLWRFQIFQKMYFFLPSAFASLAIFWLALFAPPLRLTPGPAAAVLVTEFECPDCAKRFQSERQSRIEVKTTIKVGLLIVSLLR